MDAILQSFSLRFLLRSVFSGAFFVLSFFTATAGAIGKWVFAPADILSVGLPIALFAGVTIYGIHRSIL